MYRIIGGDNEVHGPVDANGIRRWIAEGRANGQTQAQGKGNNNWRALSTFPEFHTDLNPGSAPQYGYAIPPASAGQPVPGAVPGAIPMPPVQGGTNGMAVTSMIMGILSLLCTYPCLGLPFNILGIIFGGVGLGQIKRNPMLDGRGMAIAGLVMSILSAALLLLLFFTGMAAKILNDLK